VRLASPRLLVCQRTNGKLLLASQSRNILIAQGGKGQGGGFSQGAIPEYTLRPPGEISAAARKERGTAFPVVLSGGGKAGGGGHICRFCLLCVRSTKYEPGKVLGRGVFGSGRLCVCVCV
jgi:hypothetical protein